jgi:acetolactate decarboxylase
MKSYILCFIILIVMFGCNNFVSKVPIQKRYFAPTFFQYNTWGAFVNKVFDGNMTVKELKEKGDIGLGSFDLLDGEMVMNNGIAYRITEDGVVSIGKDEDEIVYADAVFFKANEKFQFLDTLNYDGLRKQLNKKLPSKNNFYAFKITGVFDSIVLGGLHKQTPPFVKGLDVLIPARPVFKGNNISGTMIGFYCPQFIGDINAAGYHFHFISDDKTLGGHVMEIKASKVLQAAVQKLVNYQFRLPEGMAFDTVQFDKQFQYNKK